MKVLLLWVLFFQGWAFAQPWKRPEVASQWFFGAQAGLENLQTSSPNPVAGSLCTYEGASTICDSLGNFLFYTNGIKVYNKNHVLMQNGDSLGAGPVYNNICENGMTTDGSSSTQGALIIPTSYEQGKYYIMTTKEMGIGDLPTQYSVVDMSADSGRGAVIEKNMMIHPRGTEKQAAVRHANGRDWWHLFHLANSDSFGVGLIDDTLHYQYQKTGNVVWNTGNGIYAGGEMRFNWRGDVLLNLVQNIDYAKFDFFDFDRNTGQLNYIPTLSQDLENQLHNLHFNVKIYSACFSPNNEYLYFDITETVMLDVYDYLYQYNLRSKSLTLIYSLNNQQLFGQVQLAANGVMYLGRLDNCILPIIQNPNLAYPACGFTLNGIATQIPIINCTRASKVTLQNAAVFADPELTGRMSISQGVACGEVVFTDSSGGHFYRLWDFGDGAWSDTLPVVQSAEFLGLTDTFQVIHHTYTDTGWFQVRLFLLHSDTLSATLTKWIHISNCQLTATENENFCPQNPDIQVYPNPTSGILNIQSKSPASIRLTDLTGRVIFENPSSKVVQELNLKDLSKGVYLLEIEMNERREVRKVVRE